MFKKSNSTSLSKKISSSNEGDSIAALFHQPLPEDTIEIVRTTIKNAHVFKLPPRQTVSVGWRGAEWKEKVWQGTIKVIERGEHCAVVLLDPKNNGIFAVCPVREGAVDRCIDSSRYFVLRIENAKGRHMFIGVAFNERNDAFDFNTALEDYKREKEAASRPVKLFDGPKKDYSMKKGEKIRVNIPKRNDSSDDTDEEDKEDKADHKSSPPSKGMKAFFNLGGNKSTGKKKSGKKTKSSAKNGKPLLAPSSKDTPSRVTTTSHPSRISSHVSPPQDAPPPPPPQSQLSPTTEESFFSDEFKDSLDSDFNYLKAASGDESGFSDDPFFN